MKQELEKHKGIMMS